jgi:S1-C subfamily serine protease
MTLPFFSATLAAWRAAYTEPPGMKKVAEDAAHGLVKLSIKALPGARTADTLGTEREGTGVVIDDRGHILTIGYLVLEAASILVLTADGRVYPATVAGFDHATGFGLLRAQPGFGSRNIEMGSSDSVRELNTMCIAAHGGAGGTSYSSVVARRRFTGWWEYMIDDAIFTSPPRYDHSGAALLDSSGRLVGIASLWVSDALEQGVAFPGNMFVPTDLLKPLIDDLIELGRRRGPARPWLGVYSEQYEGHVVVSRVLPDSPAEEAGLQRGDIILGLGGHSIGGRSDFYRKLWTSGEAGCEIKMHILHNKAVKELTVQTTDRMQYLKTPGLSN